MSIENQKDDNIDLETLKKELLHVYKKTTTLYEYYSKLNTEMSEVESEKYQELLREFDIGQSFEMVSDIATRILNLRQDKEIEIERRIMYLRRRGIDCSQKALDYHNLLDEMYNSLSGQYDWEERDRLEGSYHSKTLPLVIELHNATIGLINAVLEFCDYLFDVLNSA